ncbi:unnamed protein product [Mycena citricolor]|uniref:ARM repeat-containing protein n=1 Tax=Mycena citricolor TaxID=2018698 RepID=A0AAD2Q2I4_9AGAR|nr:unnamed protein product [Mycena citricolor]
MSEEADEELQGYLSASPYECETPAEMIAKLEWIVSKMHVLIKTKNWALILPWDIVLEGWLHQHYPIPKAMRAKLAQLYYELMVLPGIDARLSRMWVQMFMLVIDAKPGMPRKLEPADLQLSWAPLWRALAKELWPSGRKRSDLKARNTINLLIFAAEHARAYFPASEIPDMLATMLPLTTQSTMVGMFPVLVSFLPLSDPHLYMPTLLSMSKACNSIIVDERILERAAELSEAHAASSTAWKDIGIWSHADWNYLIGKGMSAIEVPVGGKGSLGTAANADTSQRWATRIKKTISRQQCLAKILVYSMAVDGDARDHGGLEGGATAGFVAGSQALDTLDRLLTSVETYFHPSNSGPYTVVLTSFLTHTASYLYQRWKEEELPSCETPASHRLTASIRRGFVGILRTPALLAMFSKDPLSMGYAQTALKTLSILEPNLIMPELIDRAYNGLEVVNETHRTTAVLTMLTAISRTLVTERIWFPGQKHLVPLLELSLPGIDLNDPVKTACATTFIVAAVQHIRVGDLSTHASGLPLVDEEAMDVDSDTTPFPAGSEMGEVPQLSRTDERALVRDSTAGFADWVVSLFRRVLALFENLPEEGGRRNTTGGKQEETVLSSIKSMMDIVCLHLSDHLFELVLRLVYDYGTTNAKSNAVRAFGQLVGCLARVQPEQTMAKFLPFCIAQVEEELRHGASSVRTTSSSAAIPSDTTLHWNMSILRGCLSYGGPAILKYKKQVIDLLILLTDKTKGERGYSGTGRMLSRILNNVASIYPINNRFVNSDEWQDPAFEKDHNAHWGKLYEAKDVKVEWHVPSDAEIEFVLEILDTVQKPLVEKLEELVPKTSEWDGEARNDFCRYLFACRSIWAGLPTLYREYPHLKNVVAPLIRESEVTGLVVSSLNPHAGFTLTDPADPRYQKVLAHRERFGELIVKASSALRQKASGDENDHIDAVMGVTRSMDVYLLSYGTPNSTLESLIKNYKQARDANRIWVREKANSRLVFVKRAQMYHNQRLALQTVFRLRSELDDRIIVELVEMSLSSYTRIRRQAQAVYYIRFLRYVLPIMLAALGKGNDPDRMKGSLYVLADKPIMLHALSDVILQGDMHRALLECQHEEKPSIQKLVTEVANEFKAHFREESGHSDSYTLPTDRVEAALAELQNEFTPAVIDKPLLDEAMSKTPKRVALQLEMHQKTVSSILEIAQRPLTHWRYTQIAVRFLTSLLRREMPAPAQVARFFVQNSVSPQNTIQSTAQMAIVKLALHVKMRTYAKSPEQLWFEEWDHPVVKHIPVADPMTFLGRLNTAPRDFFVDKLESGFLLWTPTVRAYYAGEEQQQPVAWESESLDTLREIHALVTQDDYFGKLAALWSQESVKNTGSLGMRPDNVSYIKTLAKMFEGGVLDELIAITDSLLADPDKFKQRAGGEFMGGLWRGSKHWPKSLSDQLWKWSIAKLDVVFTQLKPDTFGFWKVLITSQLQDRDPRRNQPLIDWLLARPLDFSGDSVFEMSKSLYLLGLLPDTLGERFTRADETTQLLFANMNIGFNEIRTHISTYLHAMMTGQWQPLYPTLQALTGACESSADPLKLRDSKYGPQFDEILVRLGQLREERLPPPRVSQSEYDKIGLTFLSLVWISSFGTYPALIFPHMVDMMPEILRMSELNDSSELQLYSTGVLYVVSAAPAPPLYVPEILGNFITAIKSSTSWRIRLLALPTLVIFFYRNLMTISTEGVSEVMDVLLLCLSDENVEVRQMASNVLSGVVRCSQRASIVPLKNRFLNLARKTVLPARRDAEYANALRSLHSAILGLCALIESFPYTVEPWMPPLTDVLAAHATDPPPISTTIRKCASEFKKTHQDTWHKDQLSFGEEYLQNLSTMLVGTSYYA